MSNPLVVPINVRALCINDPMLRIGQPSFIGPAADFAALPAAAANGTLEGSLYLADSIARYPTTTARIGVRLHWALPDALRRGRHADDGSAIVFPRAPNRWLVTRVMAGRDGSPVLRSWVLESDRIGRRGQAFSPTMPFMSRADAETPDAAQYFRYLGHWTDYAAWREDPARTYFEAETGQPFTAVGFGDPNFASFAPNCVNVFAFHDDFSDTLDPDQLGLEHHVSYVVSGWYADARMDPVHDQPGGMNPGSMNWTWEADLPPDRLVLSGSILDLLWSPAGVVASRPSAPDVAVGATAAEALGALIATDPDMAPFGEATNVEFMLDAVQAGLFNRINGQPGWITQVEAELHRQSFAAHHGGWTWKAVDARRPSTKDMAVAAAEVQEMMLSSDAAHALSLLNGAQLKYDVAHFAHASGQRQLYFDWYRRQLVSDERLGDTPTWDSIAPGLSEPDPANPAAGPLLDLLLYDSLDRLDRDRHTLGSLSWDCDADGNDMVKARGGQNSLAMAIDKAWQVVRRGLPRNARLKRVPGPRFWAPADPVLLLRGAAAQPADRGGSPDDLSVDGLLPCRLGHDLLRPAGLDADVDPNFLAPRVAIETARLEPEIATVATALIAEALLLDPRFVETVQGALNGPALSNWRDAALTSGPGKIPPGGLVAGTVAPAFTRSLGDPTDWAPVLLRWTLRYGRVADTGADGEMKALSPAVLTTDHRLDPDLIDLQLPDGPISPVDWREYSGWVPLASRPTAGLTAALTAAAVATPAAKAEFDALAADLKRVPIMAQAAGGFHEALLMSEQTMQLKIADLVHPELGLAANVAEAAGRITGHAPAPEHPYAGIRSGLIQLAEAAVVDVFGREISIDTSRAIWSRGLTRGGDTVLPARIVQPSRIQFRWLSANRGDVEATDHPATTPICGWVIANYLNRSLDLYSAAGAVLGSLASTGGQGVATWRAKVGAKAQDVGGDVVAQLAAISATILDPELAAFASALVQTPGYLDDLLRTLDVALATIVPHDPGSGMALVMGRPLVLARVALSLELKGGAALDQGWQALRESALAAARGNWNGVRSDQGLSAVKVPVRIGDMKLAHDGLVGFFPSAGPERYSCFYSPAVQVETPYQKVARPIEVAASDAQPTVLSLLLDPRAPVHVTTGVLPVKAIDIPADVYADAMSRLQVAFYAGPLLFPGQTAPLNLPRLPGTAWSWWTRTGDDWMPRDLTSTPLPNPRSRLEEGWAVLTNTRDPVGE